MRIIPRRIERALLKYTGWKMLYGRRKTGKTFLVEHFLDYDEFFFVNKDGTVHDRLSNDKMTYQEFMRLFPRLVKEKRRIVIDEFHRLPEGFLDLLHAYSTEQDSQVILVTSTMWLAQRLLSMRESPLLGIAFLVKIGLIDEREILVELSKEVKGKELIEASTYLREPMLVPAYKPPLRDFLTGFFSSSGSFVSELVGETFNEEGHELTRVYLGIMMEVANGKGTSTELSSALFSRGLLKKDNPGTLQKYLTILTKMGILRKFLVQGKRRKKFVYRHASPLLDLHFYLEGKYAYTELETSVEFIRKAVDYKLPRHVEDFIADLLAKAYGLRRVSVELPELELDVALQGFNRLELVGEVKWKERVKREELRKIEEKLSRFDCRRVLVVPSEDVLEREPEGIEVLTPEDLVEIARESLEKTLKSEGEE
ncbi:AAA family ATPase [Thermococcus radiotolerans]|uniref:ATPase n=1 Tax=Thermococcus radiotolerans TaxID=187880 RepID=A0A2Z2N8P6_9EURY|nr:AAA family ATPase [Thermococcus radiotolerans]ASJ14096.1 ATPase [Thermococcus radiotolerans]